MHPIPHTAAALAFAALGLLAAAEARAADPISPASAFEPGGTELPLPADAPAIAVEPRPLPWTTTTAQAPAPTLGFSATLVGGPDLPTEACGSCPPAPCGCADRWRWSLTLPIWIPDVSGTFASGGATAHGDRSPPDLSGTFEKLLPDVASSLEFAFMGRVLVEKGPWSLMADGLYASLGQTVDWRIRDTDTTGSLEAAIVRVLGAWQTTRWLGCGPCATQLRYGPLLGARGYMVDLHIERANGAQIDGDRTWVDPIVGLKADFTFRNGASIDVIADIGAAFDGTHYSWSVSAELTWPLGHGGHWFILGGWTILNVDHDIPLGSKDLGIHLNLSGPHLGITYRF